MSSSALAAGLRHLRRQLAAEQSNEESDEQLLCAFTSRRDEAAFAVLVRRHGPMVLHVCRRVLGHEHDAEDAFQATFLILARNAVRLRNQSSLASFLHGIAYRTALKAKQSAARRRKHEGQAASRSSVNPADELSWREVRVLLDQEIERLPEKYRSVFVLCHLENLSRAAAGQRLGLKERTVLSRLAEARKRLARRLSRRGVELTAVLAAIAFFTPSAGLMANTIEAAMAAVDGMTGVISASVAELVKAMTAAMMVSKTKIATMLVLVVMLVGGAGLAWNGDFRFLSGGRQPPETSESRGADAPRSGKQESAKSVQIHGRVLAPDGKPMAGVKLLWFGEDDQIRQLGVSAADGGFTIAVPSDSKIKSRLRDWHPEYLFAHRDGFGIDFLSSGRLKAGQPVELHLVKDRSIRGRIINTEGKPVAGARVGVLSIHVYKTLDTFLTAWMKWHARQDGDKRLWTRAVPLLTTTTDVDGRFALHGAGDERFVTISISGAGLAESHLYVVNRAGFDPKPYNQAVLDKSAPRIGSGRPEILYGPDVTFVAEAGKILRGTVKAADTGKAQPNTSVWLTRIGDDLPQFVLQTKTDAQGRYEIRGIHKAKRYALQVLRNPMTGYMGCLTHIEDTSGYQPITADLTVKKGVIVTGKVIDRATGQSLPGRVKLVALSDNPFAKDYPIFGYPRFVFDVDTQADGTFRDVTIPGPILLMGEPDLFRLPGGVVEWLGFKKPISDPDYPQYFRKDSQFLSYLGFNGSSDHVRGACKVLDLKPGMESVRQDIFLDRESVQRIKIQDAQAQPLRGVWAMGLRPEQWLAAISPSAVRIEEDSCPVYGLEACQSRLMVFYERSRKLAGVRTLSGDEELPAAVQLRPAGSVTGRLLDADGKPLAGVVVDVHYRDEPAEEVNKIVHEAKLIVSDAKGAFTLDELIPALKFDLLFRRGKHPFARESKVEEATIQVKPGECRDLGDIRLKPQQ